MADKHLTEPAWKALVVKHKLADPGLAKALAVWQKADDSDIEAKLAALKAIEKPLDALLKEHKKNKDVAEHLGSVQQALEKERKALQLAAKEEARRAEREADEADEAEDDEDAAEYRRDLKKKLISALAVVRARGQPAQGDEGKPPLRFMAYCASSACAVLVAKRVSNATKKLVLQIAKDARGGRYVIGDCVFEKNMHTFVVEKNPGGLAKALARALREETGQRYKVRVRTLDGQEESDEAGDETPASAPVETPEAAETAVAPPAPPVTAGGFTARLKTVAPRIAASGAAGKPPLQGLVAQMTALAKAQDFAAAAALLDQIEALLPANADRFPALWASAKQSWLQASELVDGQITQLQAALRKSGDGELREIAEFGLNALTGNHKVPLMVMMREMDGADPARRRAIAPKARNLVASFQAHVASDERIEACDQNPFQVPMSIRETIGGALAEVAKALAAA